MADSRPWFSLFRPIGGNVSHLCQVYNHALSECHIKKEPSYIQFWEKYILQVQVISYR